MDKRLIDVLWKYQVKTIKANQKLQLLLDKHKTKNSINIVEYYREKGKLPEIK